jgi:hypothetical protein
MRQMQQPFPATHGQAEGDAHDDRILWFRAQAVRRFPFVTAWRPTQQTFLATARATPRGILIAVAAHRSSRGWTLLDQAESGKSEIFAGGCVGGGAGGLEHF